MIERTNARTMPVAKYLKTKTEDRKTAWITPSLVRFAKRVLSWATENSVKLCLLSSMLLTLIIESISNHSVLDGFMLFIRTPIMFLYNAGIVMISLSLSHFFRRRNLFILLISTFWLVLGTINFILLFFRVTPFSVSDIILLGSVKSIITRYLEIYQALLLAAVILAISVGLIFLGIKAKKYKPDFKKGVLTTLLSTLSVICIAVSLQSTGSISNTFGNLRDAYRDYGFIYCFSRGVIDRGINQPSDYSDETVDKILTTFDGNFVETLELPNIIFLQLESYFDVNYLEQMSFSENPVECFTYLKENYPSGFLTVPSVGTGTANTEFEVITGMSLQFFGAGEYPYKTVLQGATCETVCYNLKELGYATHAIHNHEGTFYDRNTVFQNLGFDTFTSLEYMQKVEYNELGWAKDKALTQEIMSALGSTGEKDLIYAISVQAHGQYPTEESTNTSAIEVFGLEDDAERNQYEYYINQIDEVDAFLEELIASLSEYDEDVALVIYGDHLPNIGLDSGDIANGDLFQTEYVIWSNFDIEAENCDLYSYQLSAHVMETVGIDNGILTKLHICRDDMSDYLENLELLEYDMLYGEMISYSGENPYEPTNIKMGIGEIQIEQVTGIDQRTYITGECFTAYSVVYINDKRVETVFLNDHTLLVEDAIIESGDIIAVVQECGGVELSRTSSYIV